MDARRLCHAGLLSLAAAAVGADANAAATHAAGTAGYRIESATIDGGGGRSAAAGFVVQGTIGQPDADPLHPATGQGFELVGGFWHARQEAITDRIFADGFES